MTERQALGAFRAWVDGYPTKAAAARVLAISTTYIGDLYKGSRGLPDTILERIGLERQVRIQRRAK